MELFLMNKIETLRNQMVQEVLDGNQFTNEKVIILSQELDKYIVFYLRVKKRTSNVNEQQHELNSRRA